jgi:hypothetical protein
VFQAIGRLRKEARDEIDRLIRFLDETDNHMELEPDGGDEPSLGWNERTAREDGNLYGVDDLEADDGDDEPSLGSHELPSGAVCYLPSVSLGEIDCEGEHDGREPDVDDDPSLGSVSTLNQTAWAAGSGNDLEHGTTRRIERPEPGHPVKRSGDPVMKTPAELAMDLYETVSEMEDDVRSVSRFYLSADRADRRGRDRARPCSRHAPDAKPPGQLAALCLPGCDFGALMRDCAYQRESDVGEWDSEVV